MLRLSEADHAKVSAAIAAAEARSDGEIVAVATDRQRHLSRRRAALGGAGADRWCWRSAPRLPERAAMVVRRCCSAAGGPSRRCGELLTFLLVLAVAQVHRGAADPQMHAAAAGADPGATKAAARAAPRDRGVQGGGRAPHGRPHRHPHLSVDGRASRRDRRRRSDHQGHHAETWGEAMAALLVEVEGGPPGRRHRRRGRAGRRGARRAFPAHRRPTPTKSPTN